MEEDGLSILEIWTLIMKRKIVVSIAFGIFTLLSFVFLVFFYNPMNTSYEANFHYYWVGIEDNKYANGMLYSPYDIISLEHVEEVKNSNPTYKNINTQNIVEGLSIEEDEDQNQTYKVTLRGNHFENDRIAKAFLEDLISIPYERALHLNFDFNANLAGYSRSKKISTKLTYLERQLNQLLEGYQNMISYFGDISINNSNLSDKLNRVQVFAANETLDHFEYLAYQNVYLTKEEYETILIDQTTLVTEQKLLRERKSVLLESLRNIYSSSNGNTYMDTSIANYLNSLHVLDTRLMKIDEDLRLIENVQLGKYNESESQAFLKELDAYRSQLEELTNEYTGSVQNVLRENTTMSIQPIKVKGKINMMISILLSFLVGIIGGLFVGFIWSYIMENKKQKLQKVE